MGVKENRSLIRLCNTLVVTLPKGWTEFWGMEKGDKVQTMYNSIFVIIPLAHPRRDEIAERVKEFLTNMGIIPTVSKVRKEE